MPREGAIIFRDLVGKLEVLNVECDKCGRRGRYHLHRLIERYGIDAKLFDWSDEITADCPRKQANNPQRYLRRAVPGFVKGCLGLGIPYPIVASKWTSWKRCLTSSRDCRTFDRIASLSASSATSSSSWIARSARISSSESAQS